MKLIFAFAAVALSAGLLHAQAPAPVPQQTAAPAPAAVAPAAALPAQGSASSAAVLQALQQIKAANDELLKQQATTLQQLEEIEKTADQIRILTQRS